MKSLLPALIALCVAGTSLAAEPALVVTLKWEGETLSVDKVEKKEMTVPTERGMPQLVARFFELQDGEGNVHFSGSLDDARDNAHAERPANHSQQLVIPDIPEARKLIFMKRVSPDPDKGRQEILRVDL